jgi:hypothetical protein
MPKQNHNRIAPINHRPQSAIHSKTHKIPLNCLSQTKSQKRLIQLKFLTENTTTRTEIRTTHTFDQSPTATEPQNQTQICFTVEFDLLPFC